MRTTSFQTLSVLDFTWMRTRAIAEAASVNRKWIWVAIICTMLTKGAMIYKKLSRNKVTTVVAEISPPFAVSIRLWPCHNPLRIPWPPKQVNFLIYNVSVWWTTFLCRPFWPTKLTAKRKMMRNSTDIRLLWQNTCTGILKVVWHKRHTVKHTESA
jgi:hypothetical protein